MLLVLHVFTYDKLCYVNCEYAVLLGFLGYMLSLGASRSKSYADLLFSRQVFYSQLGGEGRVSLVGVAWGLEPSY